MAKKKYLNSQEEVKEVKYKIAQLYEESSIRVFFEGEKVKLKQIEGDRRNKMKCKESKWRMQTLQGKCHHMEVIVEVFSVIRFGKIVKKHLLLIAEVLAKDLKDVHYN